MDHDPRADRDQVGVHLEHVLAVLEHVGRRERLGRQLPGPARGHEPAAGLGRDRRAEDEAARLGPDDEVGVLGGDPGPRARTIVWLERGGVGQQRRDVLEPDPGGREVVDLADARAQVDRAHRRPPSLSRAVAHGAAISRTSRQRSRLASSWARSVRRLEVGEPGGAPLGVARAQRGGDHLVEQRGLAVGRGAERPQVAGVDAEAGQLRADDRDVDVGLGVALLGAAARSAPAARTPRAPWRTRPRSPARSQSSSNSIERDPLPEPRRPPALALGGARDARARRGSRAAAGTRRAGGAGSSRAVRGRAR